MRQPKLSLFILSAFVWEISFAGPWYTGPLLAPAGHTIPKGHTNFEMYGFFTEIQGAYNGNGQVSGTPGVRNYVANPIFSHGLTDKVDIQYGVPYNFNQNQNIHARAVGDISVTLGYQMLEQRQSKWRPDLRVTLQETLPSGNYNHLNPALRGTDATGSGSYQTALNLNFQHVLHLKGIHYYRTRLSLGYAYAADVMIDDFSTYGGNPTTRGVIRPGNQASIDLAGELSLTQRWVAVMEAYASNRQATTFTGNPGVDSNGMLNSIGRGAAKFVSLAPAIEYNFSPNIGIIGGVWFTLDGRNTAKFSSTVIALNAYW